MTTSAYSVPLVSVVMPVLNGGAYFEQAIASVLAQTYSRIELLIVDDGSTDGSDARARAWAQREPERVRVFTHAGGAHRGTSASRATALEAAQGEFVAFLDADDAWLPGMLTDAVSALLAAPAAGMTVGTALYWHGWTRLPADVLRDRIAPPTWPHGTVVPSDEFVATLLRQPELVPCLPTVVMRRSALRESGVDVVSARFDDLYEDQALFLAVGMRYPVAVRGACLTFYRQHAASTWARSLTSRRDHVARLHYLAWLREELDGTGHTEEGTRAALANAEHAARANAAQAHSDRARASSASRARSMARSMVRSILPPQARRRLRRLLRTSPTLPVGTVSFGDLRRTTPFCGAFGYSRGTPVDRRYIEEFLYANAGDVRGRTLEIGDATYTMRFGGTLVTHPDVLHVNASNPHATIIADLETWSDAPEGRFDCILLTQTLHLLYDMRGVMSTLHRLLAPGGVLLLTVPGLSPIDRGEWRDRWYWSLTEHSVRRLIADAFGATEHTVHAYGNVLTASAFLYGLAAEELTDAEYAVHDPSYAVVVAARVRKAALPLPAGMATPSG